MVMICIRPLFCRLCTSEIAFAYITLPGAFIKTILQMMKAWTLLLEWSRCAELSEREGLGTACDKQVHIKPNQHDK